MTMFSWLKKKRKKDNKGFTLVELVVVIAILAILIGLLVPQYTKYVDKARKSSDANNLANMVRAVEIEAADPNGTLKPDTALKITISKDKDVDVTSVNNNETAAKTAIKSTVGADALGTRLKSTNWKDSNDVIDATIVIGKDYSFTVDYSKNVDLYISGEEKTPSTSSGTQQSSSSSNTNTNQKQ